MELIFSSVCFSPTSCSARREGREGGRGGREGGREGEEGGKEGGREGEEDDASKIYFKKCILHLEQ